MDNKKKLDGIRRIAIAHYDAAPEKLRTSAKEFFRQLNPDRNGCVSLPEFLSFMEQQINLDSRLRSRSFYDLLDRDGNRVLDFSDVMTLYYIIKSGRPFCDSCSSFITDTYYSCVACFHSHRGPFTLCHDCYRNRRNQLLNIHNHNGRVQFLDNYTLLQLKRTSDQQSQHVGGSYNNQQRPSLASMFLSQSSPGAATTVAMHQSGSSNQCNAIIQAQRNQRPSLASMVRSQSSPGAATTVAMHQSGSSNQSNAIIQAQRNIRWIIAFRALEAGISIGNVAATLCSIL